MIRRALFIDTNVLVYAAIDTAPKHVPARRALAQAEDEGAACVSRQVLREFLATLTRPSGYHQPIPVADAVDAIRDCAERFRILEDGPAVTTRLLELVQRVPVGGRQVHDANIVATMLAHGVRRLLTDNVGDFVRFGGLIDVEPLTRP